MERRKNYYFEKERWQTISDKGLRINENIRAGTVRLIDEQNNQVGIVQRYEALSNAREAGLDLVEVAPLGEPPVCRIMDYGKWLYDQKRKARLGHKKSVLHASTLKGIRLKPGTDPHDLGIKVKHAQEFLEKGHKVQFTVFFRGRQMLHKERGYEILNQISESLEEASKVEQPPRMAGRRMMMMLVPK
jgi:translation initiation factor IF-3